MLLLIVEVQTKQTLTVYWDLQELSTILPSLPYKETLINERVKKSKKKNYMQFDSSILKFTKNAQIVE